MPVVYFRRSGVCMAPAVHSMIAFLALIVWRFVFAGSHRWRMARGIAPQQHRHNNLLEEGLHILAPGDVEIIAGNRLENGSDGLDPRNRKDRAKRYLCRVVALTGATQIGDAYVLDVGKMRFQVRDRYVRRMRDVTDPECGYEQTCFYPVHKGMPKVEEIATALLQLKNNPALFDKWALQSGAFKADGQAFSAAP
jgi:hypothetical protein